MYKAASPPGQDIDCQSHPVRSLNIVCGLLLLQAVVAHAVSRPEEEKTKKKKDPVSPRWLEA